MIGIYEIYIIINNNLPLNFSPDNLQFAGNISLEGFPQRGHLIRLKIFIEDKADIMIYGNIIKIEKYGLSQKIIIDQMVKIYLN